MTSPYRRERQRELRAANERDAELYRLEQARELLRQSGFVPVPGTDNWVLPGNADASPAGDDESASKTP